MFLDPTDRFLILFFAGLGLVLIATANLCLRRQRIVWRFVMSGVILVVLVSGFAQWHDQGNSAIRLALALTLALAMWLVLTSERVIVRAACLMRFLARPLVSWLSLGLVGLLTLLSSVGMSDQLDSTATGLNQIMRSAGSEPPRIAPAAVCAYTDRGSSIALSHAAAPRPATDVEDQELTFLAQTAFRDLILRRSPAHDRTNCHGWVFTGGRFWVSGTTVEQILQENAYRPVAAPRRDDLVVYRNNHSVCHTAVVSYVTEGMPVLVEGKWGPLGIYMHAVDQSTYGKEFTYFRSDRAGHLLLGLPGESETHVTQDTKTH